MAKKAATAGNMKIVSPDGPDRRFARFVWTVVVLLVVLLVAGVFVARTDGCASLVESWLEKRLGMELAVGSTSIGFPYSLVIDDVISEGFGESPGPGLKIGEIRLSVRLAPFLNVSTRNVELNLYKGEDGSWQPLAFGRLSGVPWADIAAISKATEPFRHRMRFRSENASISWLDGENVLASAGGIVFEVHPVRLAEKRLFFHSLTVYNAVNAAHQSLQNLEREWLAGEGIDCVEITGWAVSTTGAKSMRWAAGESSGGEQRERFMQEGGTE